MGQAFPRDNPHCSQGTKLPCLCGRSPTTQCIHSLSYYFLYVCVLSFNYWKTNADEFDTVLSQAPRFHIQVVYRDIITQHFAQQTLPFLGTLINGVSSEVTAVMLPLHLTAAAISCWKMQKGLSSCNLPWPHLTVRTNGFICKFYQAS